jgi:hypothetical protein
MRIVIAMLSFQLLALPAYSQQQRDPEKAIKLVDAAKRAKALGNNRRSIEKLLEAYKYLPDPRILVNVARRYIDLNEPQNALKELRAIKTGNRQIRKLIAAEIKKIEDLVSKPLLVTFDTEPPGALVTFESGDPLTTPGRRNLKRGQYKVTVFLDGYEKGRGVVSVKGIRPVNRTWKLKSFHGHVRIAVGGLPAGAKATVLLDDKPIELGIRHKVPRGKHWVKCSIGGEHENQLLVDVGAGGDLDVRCVLTGIKMKKAPWKTIAAWTSIGVGAAVVATGVALFVSHSMDMDQYQPPQYTIESETKQLGGGVSLGVGAGLIGLGTYWLFSE